MRLLHYIEIENFKTFGNRQRIELDHPAVIIGPNNCGKTSVVQAIALWSQAVKTWHEARKASSARERSGTPLNRLTILNVPVERTRFFWHETKVRTGNIDIPLVITAGVFFNGVVHPVPMRFRNQGEDLVYCSPDDSVRDQTDLIAHAASLDVELLYPMSGLETEEAVLQPGRINVLLGQGQTAQVLRNLCLMVHRASPKDWGTIVGWMQRLFQVRLDEPRENSRGAIDLHYRQDGVKEPLSLSSAGRGFQQMLLMFAYLFSHKKSVLLIDEPDAHLEILRQRQVFVLLRDIATQNESQVVIVTHSEVILDAAMETNLTLLLEGRAKNVAKASIRESLKLYGAAHYVQARQRGYVLYFEGGTDADILRAFAERLNHAAIGVWDENPNVYFVRNVHPASTVETEVERAEEGFGASPRDHFNALRKLLPGLRGLAILDSDGRARTGRNDAGLQTVYWQRYEIENYFIMPEVLLAYVAYANLHLGLFAIAPQVAGSVLDELVEEVVFGGNRDDLWVWKNSAPEAARLIWDKTTQSVKLSAFAEEFFRRLAVRAGVEALLRKSELHRLIAFVEPARVAREVSDKLDLLAEIFAHAGPILDTPDDA
ncbi:MAG: AAA family ATPase [Bryobacterales bacterium]|nr:AAA family ATPase [Bryobacterales bacterium]